MQAFIETTEASTVSQLAPIVHLVQNFQGHINRNYSHGSIWCSADVAHKKVLMEKIDAIKPETFVMGCGAGHIWLAQQTATAIEWSDKQIISKTPVAEFGGRILLIID